MSWKFNLNERAFLPDGCRVEDLPGYLDDDEDAENCDEIEDEDEYCECVKRQEKVDEGESREDYDYDRRFD